MLLGRGGSDTSGAYFAAKLSARDWKSGPTCPACSAPIRASVPSARLLRELHYDEAQEIASNGAKVLHPRCVLPVREYHIPLHVYATQTPELEGTHVSRRTSRTARPRSRPSRSRRASRWSPWRVRACGTRSGFLADAFEIFKHHGLSVDLVSTSETNVTVSLDPSANTLDPVTSAAVTQRSAELCRVEIHWAVRLIEPVGAQHSRHPA